MLFSALFLIFFVAILYLLVRPIVRGAMYVPIPREVAEKTAKIVAVKPGEKAADLGSGDGRILIALAKAGADATGYEINPLLVLLSRHRIKKAGLETKVRVYWKSFWRADLSQFDAVAVYGYPPFMEKLGEKLRREMKPEARTVALVSPFPGWKPNESLAVGKHKLYRYGPQ
ncbi:MAG TPA: SAM-dependent methyltransferase [Candidatus Paceibacterota bacterium]|nr:SAM-dependent methyltransferase [Candidatus Paceibacterota bacterium]